MKPVIIIIISVVLLFAIVQVFSLVSDSEENDTSTFKSKIPELIDHTNSNGTDENDWKQLLFPELYDEKGNRLPEYDEGILKVYVENIPDNSHASITMETVDNALDSWIKKNPDLKFLIVLQSQNSDIEITWVDEIFYTDPVIGHAKGNPIPVMGITESETTQTLDGKYVSEHHVIQIDFIDSDCNGNPIFWDEETITNTIAHEIGHALGIVHHSSDENHLMYDPNDGIPDLSAVDHGLVIPQKITDGYYIGEKEIEKQVELLDEKFVKTLAEYGWSVDDWENERKSSSNAIFYDRVNTIIEEMNPIIEKRNCYIYSTN